MPNSWDASPSINSARVGVGYELGSGSSIYARYRRGNGHYTDPTAGASTGDFRENESELAVHWPVSGKTTVDASIGHLQRRHDNGSQRDFSGAVGNAAVFWDVTGKTRVIAGVSRDLSATGLATGGHVQSTRFYIGPVWKATAQIAVNARYDRVSRDWNGRAGRFAGRRPQRSGADAVRWASTGSRAGGSPFRRMSAESGRRRA